MVGLTHAWNCLVISQEIAPAGLCIAFLFLVHDIGARIHIVVIETEDCRDIDAIRTRHTVLAAGAAHEGIFFHLVGSELQQILFFVGKRFEIQEGIQIILEVVHICHSAEYALHPRETARKAESPGSEGFLRFP